MIYNILWIDDEHESLSGLKGRAKRNDIHLIPFKSLEGGMSELERNYPQYDGVLLDAKFFESEDDEAGTEDTEASFRAKERILRLPKKFEIFVLTGQAEAFESKMYKKAFPNVYQKGKDSEVERLFVEIKQAAENQEDTQLRHEYQRVFDVCSERYIGELAGQDLLVLLKVGENLDIGVNFPDVRKIVEDIFIAFAKYNLLPRDFVSPQISLTASSKFLAGKKYSGDLFTEKGYEHEAETHIPSHIADSIKNILLITQPGAHRSDVDRHVKSVRTCYLFKSVVFQLLDILIWFKMYVDSNPKTENWVKVNSDSEETGVVENEETWILGTVINHNSQKGFAFFAPSGGGDNYYIPAHLVEKAQLENQMSISAIVSAFIDNRSGEPRTIVKKVEVN